MERKKIRVNLGCIFGYCFFVFVLFYWITNIINILISNQQWLEKQQEIKNKNKNIKKRGKEEKKSDKKLKNTFEPISYSEQYQATEIKNKIIVSVIFSHWGVNLQTPHTPARRGYKNPFFPSRANEAGTHYADYRVRWEQKFLFFIFISIGTCSVCKWLIPYL